MTIEYQIVPEGSLLRVTASGRDDNLEEVKNYGMAIIDAALTNHCTRVLCDESQLEYRLSTIENYESAEFIARKAPHVGKVAIVYNPTYLKDARFWETVAVNRGLTVCFFKTLEEAEAWLE